MSFASALSEDLRKARPVQVIEQSLVRGRLAHAIMLHGKDPAALASVANSLAAHLLHTSPERIDRHPDFFTLRPARKARLIRIGEHNSDPNTMREFIYKLQLTANQGDRKVGVVFDADRMNAASANAFLKTLEEPPAGTTLLLLTTAPYRLLDTIRSRCFNFRLPSQSPLARRDPWNTWLQAYHEWIIALLRGPKSAEDRAHAVLSVNALVLRFRQVNALLADELWKEEKQRLPDYLDDDERDATEIGIRKGIRQQLLVDLENATREFALNQWQQHPFSPLKLARVIALLESSTSLLELNMKDEAVMEAFLLGSLRIWPARD